ncbi:hypothetical protein BP6252_03923 [Coleophoma cylindrospora]|uniref:Uncharacterized protein n=1 Tax=Coleophoma cylindrospora TaxID=1849047 RepID=A0A3D8S9J5_9HELO|nr:hypothetical protein BP6252_03923 [Coleophoma cylindrospora]
MLFCFQAYPHPSCLDSKSCVKGPTTFVEIFNPSSSTTTEERRIEAWAKFARNAREDDERRDRARKEVEERQNPKGLTTFVDIFKPSNNRTTEERRILQGGETSRQAPMLQSNDDPENEDWDKPGLQPTEVKGYVEYGPSMNDNVVPTFFAPPYDYTPGRDVSDQVAEPERQANEEFNRQRLSRRTWWTSERWTHFRLVVAKEEGNEGWADYYNESIYHCTCPFKCQQCATRGEDETRETYRLQGRKVENLDTPSPMK